MYGDDFKREIQRTEDVTVNNPVPRGKMFDRNGKIIVDNKPIERNYLYKKSKYRPKRKCLKQRKIGKNN